MARTAVIHVDDIGMSHAANEGAFEALANGPATCGSIMVPCPWFPEAAERARADPGLDLGVHLTLNAEYEHYRWGPVLGAEAVPSLVDAEGYLPRMVEEVVATADPGEVERELRAQIRKALDAGIDVTHLDSHMGTVFADRFFAIYVGLGREFDLPLFVVRASERSRHLDTVSALEADGWPLFDGFCADSLGFDPGDGDTHNRRRIAELGEGLNYLICHAAHGGPELDAITDDAHARDFERTFYGGEAGRRVLADEGIETIGMRELRERLRA